MVVDGRFGSWARVRSVDGSVNEKEKEARVITVGDRAPRVWHSSGYRSAHK